MLTTENHGFANQHHADTAAVADRDAIRPFHIHFPEAALADLRQRLA
jgi:hypothetical protein